MDPVDFLFADAQLAYEALKKERTPEHAEVVKRALAKLNEEVHARIALLVPGGAAGRR